MFHIEAIKTHCSIKFISRYFYLNMLDYKTVKFIFIEGLNTIWN